MSEKNTSVSRKPATFLFFLPGNRPPFGDPAVVQVPLRGKRKPTSDGNLLLEFPGEVVFRFIISKPIRYSTWRLMSLVSRTYPDGNGLVWVLRPIICQCELTNWDPGWQCSVQQWCRVTKPAVAQEFNQLGQKSHSFRSHSSYIKALQKTTGVNDQERITSGHHRSKGRMSAPLAPNYQDVPEGAGCVVLCFWRNSPWSALGFCCRTSIWWAVAGVNRTRLINWRPNKWKHMSRTNAKHTRLRFELCYVVLLYILLGWL